MEVANLIARYQADTRDFDAGSARVSAKLRELEVLANRATATVGRSGTQGAAEAARVSQSIITGNGNRIKSAESVAVATAKSNGRIVTGELSMARQLAAVASLQRQRSAALIADWRRTEKAARDVAAGVLPLRTGLARLTDVMQGLRASTATLQGPLGSISGRLGSIATLATEAGTGLGLLGVIAGAAAVASVGAAFGIYKLVTASAEATGHLHDLSQQTGFSVETLSALKNAAETSGGSIESVTTALFLFETKMGEAKDRTSEMSRIFKVLKIDTTDNEKALRQAISAMLSMRNAEDQATLGKKLFGRSVKDLLGAIKEAGGLDAFLNKQIREGTLITTKAAEKGDDLSDSVIELGRQFSAASRLVADEFAPTVEAALKDVSTWLINNRSEITAWAKTFAEASNVILTHVGYIAKGLKELLTLSPIEIRIIETITRVTGGEGGTERMKTGQAAGQLFRAVLNSALGGGIPGGAPYDKDTRMSTTPGSTNTSAATTDLGDLLSGKGKGGGSKRGQDPAEVARRLAAITLQETIKGYQAQQEALDRFFRRELDSQTTYNEASNQLNIDLHNATIAGLNDELIEAQSKRRGSAVAVAEVNAKFADENRRYAKRNQELFDDSEDYNLQQVRITGEARVALAKTIGEGILRVHQITNEQHKARFADLAQFQLVTETDAAEKSKQAELKLFDERDALLDVAYDEREKKMDFELRHKFKGSNDYIQIERDGLNDLRQINFERGELESDRSAFTEDADRRIAASRIQDVQNLQQYHDQIAGVYLDISDAAQQAAEATISPLRDNVFARGQVIEFDRQMDQLRESERAKEAIRRLADQRELNELQRHHAELAALDMSSTEHDRQTASDRADQLLNITQGLDREIEAQHKLSSARMVEINARAAQERKQQMREIADDLAQITDDILGNLGKGWDEFWKGMAQTATDSLKRIGSEISKGFFEKLLTGDTKGSTAGGLAGGVANKILGIFGVKVKGEGVEGQIVSLDQNTQATIDNTLALRAHAFAPGGGSSGGGLLGLVLGAAGAGFGGGGKGDLPFGGLGGGVEGKALASGMDFIPYDGFKAVLHRGERVVPARENFRPNISNQIMNTTSEGGGVFSATKSELKQTNLRIVIADTDRQARDQMATSDEAWLVKAKRNRTILKTLLN